MKKYLLFDLDGTLSDPKVGICTCVQYALKAFGIEEPDIDKLEPFIGPPLTDSFMEFYGMDKEQAVQAVEKYRERFSTVGMFENELYPGIVRMLKKLQQRGMVLAVASSKPTVYVEKILEHFHIRKYFHVVVGSELDGRRVEKNQVIEEALRQLFDGKRVDLTQIYMIGDRKFDVIGAKSFGIESVAVAYGYGSIEELMEAKADYIVRSVEELTEFLMRGTGPERQQSSFSQIWSFGFPFLMFFLVKALVTYMMAAVFTSMGGRLFGMELLVRDTAGRVTGLSGNGSALNQIVGFVIASVMIWPMARAVIVSMDRQRHLVHLKPSPVSVRVLYAGTVICGVLGLNLLLELTGVTAKSEGYQATSGRQYEAAIWLGFLLTVVVAPVAEELLFRGVLYNCLRRMMKPIAAMVVGALFFGVYHGNSVQGIYGFLMGCVIIYGYEYFGGFGTAVLTHAGANLVAYSVSILTGGLTGVVSWPLCILFMGCFVAGLGVMAYRKRQLRHIRVKQKVSGT